MIGIKRLPVASMLILLFVAATATFQFGWAPAGSKAQDASEPDAPNNTLYVFYGSTSTRPFESLVELFRDGKRLRSRQLTAGNSVEWANLHAGEYEVHCSAPDYAKTVYRILVSKNDVTRLSVTMNKDKPVVVGGGVTIDDLLKQLTEVQTANAELQERVKHLESEVAALKKAVNTP